jgi:glycosyltransferase involved in cell wall biosynthesis
MSWVAMVTRYYDPYLAGAECQARLLADRLAASLDRCDVVTTRYDRQLPRMAREGKVRIRRLGAAFPRGRRAAEFLEAFVYFLLRGWRYRVVHAHCLSSFCLGAVMAARLWGCRTLLKICTIGEEGDIGKVKRHFLGRILWRLFLRCDGFVAPTPAMVPYLLATGIPAHKILLVPNFVAAGVRETPCAAARQRARAALGLPERPTVLFVGRLCESKGLELLREAWSEIARKHDATLVLVGGGPEEERLERWTRESSCGGSVRLCGWRPDPQIFYRASDVFVFPSREESFGTVLAEAMVFGLAVVTSPVGLAQVWMRPAENGIVIRSRAPSDWAAQIGGLLEDPERRERLGLRAREEALDHFGEERVVAAYLELYETLAARAARPEP